MTDEKTQTTTAGSEGIPLAGNKGVILGSGAVPMDEHTQPGKAHAGQENAELEWGRRHIPNDPPKPRRRRKVLRKTELQGMVRTREDAKKTRKQILAELKSSCPADMLTLFDTVLRNFIDTLIERQNRIEDELLLDLYDLMQRTEDLERRMCELQGQASPARG